VHADKKRSAGDEVFINSSRSNIIVIISRHVYLTADLTGRFSAVKFNCRNNFRLVLTALPETRFS